jgi:hypothetical protein
MRMSEVFLLKTGVEPVDHSVLAGEGWCNRVMVSQIAAQKSVYQHRQIAEHSRRAAYRVGKFIEWLGFKHLPDADD